MNENTKNQEMLPQNKNMSGVKWGSNKPTEYRLAKNKDGSICLVGKFEWSGYDDNGNACGGADWQELPMMDLATVNSVLPNK